MSGEREESEWKTPERDTSSVRGLRVAAVLGGALLIFTAFVWVTWLQLQHRERHLLPRGPSTPAALGQPEINLVNTALFTLETRASEEWNARTEGLHRYGWVDRDAGLVHVPIEQGIERVVAGQRRDGGPP